MIRPLAILTAFLCLSLSAQAQDIRMEFLGASTTRLGNPHDLKLSPDGKYLYVADVDNNRVAILDPETLDFLADFGDDHQRGTHDVDFDAEGNAYVADTHNNRVTIYKTAGVAALQIDELHGAMRGPEGVLVHPNGLVYVAGAWSGNVVAYDKGRVVHELTGLQSPHDLELAPDGSIWLADAGNDRMLLLTPDLEVIREWSGAPYNFNGVRYQDVLPDGTVIAADKNSHRVLIIDPDGAVLHVMGDGKPGIGPNRFRTPEGVETRGDIVWISDSGNDRIVKYRMVR
ncbi:MAG: NHL repeat-containing protein [Alphaproteobacteria bacterium]